MFDNPATRIVAGILIAGVFFSVIMTLLPVYPLPTEVSTALDWFFDTAWTLDFVLPIQTMVQIMGILIMLDVIQLTIKIVQVVKNHSLRT